MSEESCLTTCLPHLEAIVLPDLPLPVAVFNEVDRDRVVFGIRYYVYGSIAHYRKILRGLVQVSDDANWACAHILARHLLEWAAHATFAKVKLPSLIESKRWDKAWSILLRLNGSDLYFRRFGAKHLESDFEPVDIPAPFSLADFLSVYDSQHAEQDGRGATQEDHSLLSELSHASAACMRQHQKTYENRIVFTAEDDSSPLQIASVSTIDWLLSIAGLLSSISDDTVGSKVVSALREILEMDTKSWEFQVRRGK